MPKNGGKAAYQRHQFCNVSYIGKVQKQGALRAALRTFDIDPPAYSQH